MSHLTTEEKLRHFQESSINSAYEKSNRAVREYEEALERKFEEHKREKLKHAENEIKTETDLIKRENNDKYSQAQNNIKKEFTKRSQELTEKIFYELIDLIKSYKKTEDYKKLLIKQINNVRTYVKWGEEQSIYIDSTDVLLKNELENATNCSLSVAEESFIGGIRANVSNNIYIDDSFLTKLDELEENFNLLKCIEEYKNKHCGGGINE